MGAVVDLPLRCFEGLFVLLRRKFVDGLLVDAYPDRAPAGACNIGQFESRHPAPKFTLGARADARQRVDRGSEAHPAEAVPTILRVGSHYATHEPPAGGEARNAFMKIRGPCVGDQRKAVTGVAELLLQQSTQSARHVVAGDQRITEVNDAGGGPRFSAARSLKRLIEVRQAAVLRVLEMYRRWL